MKIDSDNIKAALFFIICLVILLSLIVIGFMHPMIIALTIMLILMVVAVAGILLGAYVGLGLTLSFTRNFIKKHFKIKMNYKEEDIEQVKDVAKNVWDDDERERNRILITDYLAKRDAAEAKAAAAADKFLGIPPDVDQPSEEQMKMFDKQDAVDKLLGTEGVYEPTDEDFVNGAMSFDVSGDPSSISVDADIYNDFDKNRAIVLDYLGSDEYQDKYLNVEEFGEPLNIDQPSEEQIKMFDQQMLDADAFIGTKEPYIPIDAQYYKFDE